MEEKIIIFFKRKKESNIKKWADKLSNIKSKTKTKVLRMVDDVAEYVEVDTTIVRTYI
jgi:uncharacterized protein (DUF1499 family)